MPRVKRSVQVLMAEVTPDLVTDNAPSWSTPVAIRWAETPARCYVNDMVCAPEEFGLAPVVTDEQLMECIGLAERMLAEGTYPDRYPPPAVPSLFEPDHRRHRPVVYYMRLATLVKIGTSGNIRARLDAINPQGVMAVEWGDRRLEHARHQQFAAHHYHGEWFTFATEIGAHIATVRETFEATTGQTTERWLATVGVGNPHS